LIIIIQLLKIENNTSPSIYFNYHYLKSVANIYQICKSVISLSNETNLNMMLSQSSFPLYSGGDLVLIQGMVILTSILNILDIQFLYLLIRDQNIEFLHSLISNQMPSSSV
jgi:hypothetical protein